VNLELLEKVKDFADKAHGTQIRKYSKEKYIKHPERVMNLCREYTEDIAILSAALLHDVLEDTSTSEDQIKEFLGGVMSKEEAERTLMLVVELTDIYTNIDYPGSNRKKRKNKEADRLGNIHPDAQTIKYADTMDNAVDIVQNDRDFAKVFIKECQNLLAKMDNGHPELYIRAVKTINECAERLE
jgi:guanosine-3',5'-bis(diphosphate) 3'-pyrophosphohydrolase